MARPRSSAAPFLRTDEPLTAFDRELIALLQIDGRRSFAQLARELDATEKRVRRRVAELQEHGAIRVTAVIDPRALGYGAGALMGVELDGTRDVRSVVRELTELHAVDYVVAATGRFPIWAEAFCRDNDELLTVCGELVPAIAGVRGVEVFPYLRVHYQRAQFATALARGASGRGVRFVSLDATDSAILRELMHDGRMPAQHIALSLGVSESQVRTRMKRMTSEGALQVVALLNPLGGEYRTMAWVGVRVAAGASALELADRLAELDVVTLITLTTGRFDLFAELVCDSPEGLLRALDEHVRPLPGVAALEASVYLDLHYRPLLPASS